MEKSTLERLRAVRKHLDLNQKEMAALLGVKQSYYSEVENDKRPFPGKFVETLNREKSISSDWLYTGKGEMVLQNSDNLISPSEVKINIGVLSKRKLESELSKQDRELINAVNELPELSSMLAKFIASQKDLPTIELYSSIGAAWIPDLPEISIKNLKKQHPRKPNIDDDHYAVYKANMHCYLNHMEEYKTAYITFRKHLIDFLKKIKPLDKQNLVWSDFE